MSVKNGYCMTQSEFIRFIKQSFYRTKFSVPDSSEIEAIVGMNNEEFTKHLERTFVERYGISTEKYLDYFEYRKLCIDHIAPLRLAKTREDVIRLCRYSNFQLLLSRDNSAKEHGIDISKDHADPKGLLERLERIKEEILEVDKMMRWFDDHKDL